MIDSWSECVTQVKWRTKSGGKKQCECVRARKFMIASICVIVVLQRGRREERRTQVAYRICIRPVVKNWRDYSCDRPRERDVESRNLLSEIIAIAKLSILLMKCFRKRVCRKSARNSPDPVNDVVSFVRAEFCHYSSHNCIVRFSLGCLKKKMSASLCSTVLKIYRCLVFNPIIH